MVKQILIKLPLLLSLIFAVSACTYDDTKIESYNFTVYDYEWKWNSLYSRYECIIDFPELREDIYENGAVVGVVYINEVDYDGYYYETQKNMPYIETHTSRNDIYTEIIGFDTSLGDPSSICFYVKTLDNLGSALKTYDFKITLIGYK